MTRESVQRDVSTAHAAERLPEFLERVTGSWFSAAWPTKHQDMLDEVSALMEAVKEAPPALQQRQDLFDFYADLRDVRRLLIKVEKDDAVFRRTAAQMRLFVAELREMCPADPDPGASRATPSNSIQREIELASPVRLR